MLVGGRDYTPPLIVSSDSGQVRDVLMQRLDALRAGLPAVARNEGWCGP